VDSTENVMKFPSVGTERLHSVAAGVRSLREKVSELERYAAVIPCKRPMSRNGSSARPRVADSDTAELHVVVGDVPLDLLAGARTTR